MRSEKRIGLIVIAGVLLTALVVLFGPERGKDDVTDRSRSGADSDRQGAVTHRPPSLAPSVSPSWKRIHAANAPAEGVTLTGRVVQNVDGIDVDLEGAVVELGVCGRRKPFAGPLDRWTTRTAADGSFTFINAPCNTVLHISAQKGRTRSDWLHFPKFPPEATPEPVVLRLPAVGEIAGRVVDPEGNPVAGATIALLESHLIEWGYPTRSTKERDAFSTACDALGRFLVRGLEADGYHTLIARAEGFSLGRAERVCPATQLEDIVITLQRCASMSGRVLEGDSDRPVAGVEVKATPRDATRHLAEYAELSDAEGRFSFGEISAGTYSLSGRLADGSGAPLMLVSAEHVAIDPGRTVTGLELRAWPALTARGRVVDEGTSQGVEGASLRFYWTQPLLADQRLFVSGSSLTPTTSTEGGRFELPGLLPGHYEVDVYHREHPSGSNRTKIRLADRKIAENLRLLLPSRQGRLEGTVFDEWGATVAGIGIILERSFGGIYIGSRASVADIDLPSWQLVRSTETGADGSFSFEPIRLNESYRAVCHATGGWQYARSESVYLTEDKPCGRVEIRLEPGGTISGRVTDDKGDPLGQVSVDARPWNLTPQPGLAPYFGSGTHRLYRTDDRGSFEVDGLAPGEYRVVAQKAGHVLKEEKRVRVVAGRRTDDVDLVLEKRESFTLRGQLVGLNGRQLAGWTVRAGLDKEWDTREARTAYDGRFAVTASPKDSASTAAAQTPAWRLEFSSYQPYGLDTKGHRLNMDFHTGRFGPPDDEAIFVLPFGKGLRGRVVDQATGEPIPVFDIILSLRTKELPEPEGTDCAPWCSWLERKFRNNDGRFEIPYTPIGIYDVALRADSAVKRKLESVEIGLDWIDLGDIPLESAAMAIGRLVDAQTGEPLSPLSGDVIRGNIRIRQAYGTTDSEEQRRSLTVQGSLAEGRFEVRNIPKDTRRLELYMGVWGESDSHILGDYRMTKKIPGLDFTEKECLDLGAVSVWLGIVRGRLLDRLTGEPVNVEIRRYHVRFTDASGRETEPAYAKGNADGEFVVGGVPRDTASLTFLLGEYKPAEAPLSFVHGNGESGEANIVVELQKRR